MIVPMKKYSFLVFHEEYETFLKDIQELGVLHVIEKQDEIEESIKDKFALIKEFSNAVKFLAKRDVDKIAPDKELGGFEVLQQIKTLKSEYENTKLQVANLKKEISTVAPWGDFSVETIQKLKKSGICIKFYSVSIRRFDPEWQQNYTIEPVGEVGTNLFFVLIHKEGEEPDLPVDEIKAPERSLAEVISEKEKTGKKLEQIQESLNELAKKYIPALENAKSEIEQNSDFELAKYHTEKQANDKIMLLEGWVPESTEKNLLDFLESHDAVYISEKPTKEDKVPILLKNNWFSKLFEPIGKLYSLPAYMELDLTAFFAPFFMLFFGFCLGDAGYGLLVLLGATLYKLKADKEMKPILTLAQFLGVATILFGSISGTIFGMNLIDTGYTLTDQSIVQMQSEIPESISSQISDLEGEYFKTKGEFVGEISEIIGENQADEYQRVFVRAAKGDYQFLQSFRHWLFDSNNLFMLALVLGVIQIIFGMFIKVINSIRQQGFVYSLSTIGWILLFLSTIAFYFLTDAGILNAETDKVVLYVALGVSLFFILFFSDPEINIFARVGSGLYDIYSTVTGVMGDLLSYIRLFALGLSSAILGYVINMICLQMIEGGDWYMYILFILVLLAGHGINIFIAALGSFVHPMRLTFVEFYKNAGFAGGGKEYKPLKKIIK